MKCLVVTIALVVAMATGIKSGSSLGPAPEGGPPSPTPGRGPPGRPYYPSYTFNVPVTVSASQPPSRLCLCFSKMCPGALTVDL